MFKKVLVNLGIGYFICHVLWGIRMIIIPNNNHQVYAQGDSRGKLLLLQEKIFNIYWIVLIITSIILFIIDLIFIITYLISKKNLNKNNPDDEKKLNLYVKRIILFTNLFVAVFGLYNVENMLKCF